MSCVVKILILVKKLLNAFISFLGQKFNFDAHYFAKNTFWLLLGQGIASVSMFAVTVVLANNVPKSVLGDYRVIISVYSTLTFFALSGITPALTRSIVNGYDGSLALALATKKKYSLPAFFIGIGISFYFWVVRDNPIFGVSFLIMSLCLPAIEAYALYVPYLQGKHEFKFSSLSTGILRLSSSAAVAIAAYLHPTTIYIVGAFYGAQAVTLFVQYKVLVTKFPPENANEDKDMIPYSRHTTFAGLFYMILGQADKFIMYHFFGSISLASYWIASTIPQEVGKITNAALQVAYPKFVKGDHSTIKPILIKKLVTLTWVFVAISCIYACVAFPFFHIFFPRYIDQVWKSIVLMFGFAVVPHIFVWQYYIAQRNVKVMYISNAVDPILQVALVVAFVPFFGVWGFVYSVVAKTFILNILAWYILRRY